MFKWYGASRGFSATAELLYVFADVVDRVFDRMHGVQTVGADDSGVCQVWQLWHWLQPERHHQPLWTYVLIHCHRHYHRHSHHHHHHHHVEGPSYSIVVSMVWRNPERSWACRHAELSLDCVVGPSLTVARVRSGRPVGRCQTADGCLEDTRMIL